MNRKSMIERAESFAAVRALLAALRNLLGPRNVCIFLVTCPDYARYHLAHSNILWAGLMIGVRLLACNPLVGIIRYLFYRSFSKSVRGEEHTQCASRIHTNGHTTNVRTLRDALTGSSGRTSN